MISTSYEEGPGKSRKMSPIPNKQLKQDPTAFLEKRIFMFFMSTFIKSFCEYAYLIAKLLLLSKKNFLQTKNQDTFLDGSSNEKISGYVVRLKTDPHSTLKIQETQEFSQGATVEEITF